MDIDSPLTALQGVGSALSAKFARLGIRTVRDLLMYYPRRYDDFSHTVKLRALKPGQVSTKAVITQVVGRYVRAGLHVCEALVSDDTGSARLVWFNQPYRLHTVKKNQEYFIAGQFGLKNNRLAITNPSIELASEMPIHTARIVPIYRETKGLTSPQIRRTLRAAQVLIQNLPETLPAWMVRQYKLLPRAEAVWAVHFPSRTAQLEIARRRLGFEELLELCLAGLMNRLDVESVAARKIPFNQTLARKFVSHLPFQLTDDQRRAVWQIYQDMDRPRPMNRLVEGDVGSGKTVVAAMAAVMAMAEGFQVAMMAPTELLARQHADTLHTLLKPLGYHESVSLLVGGLSASAKLCAHKGIADGTIRLIVGTHALVQEKVAMPDLGLAIIDEQHRFGVDQRRALQAKAGTVPHLLSMTATPIPRSLALTVYGELEVSILAMKPSSRKQIKTALVTFNGRADVYKEIAQQVSKGRQAFVVCPSIEAGNNATVRRSAQQTYQELTQGLLARYKIGLLHGKLKTADKNQIMQQFVDGKLDVLVATTVIEVGVDVPNATSMVIENADYFGLAQLHQLRGRIGRGHHQGYCYLVTSDTGLPSPRLNAIATSTDGFKLAELDLRLRGPGAIYGTLQHGQLDLRIATLTDVHLIAEARSAAHEFINRGHTLLQYKELGTRVTRFRQITTLN